VTPDHRLPADDTPHQSAWGVLRKSLTPRATRGQVVTGVLCAVVGFALVVQVQANRSEGLSSLRQDELVRILDDVTRRTSDLQDQILTLRARRAELVTGSDTERAAREAAVERAEVQGILAGRLPAEGPGIELTIREPADRIPAAVLYNVLEELRNAGAEVIQVGDLRLTASSFFIDTPRGVEVDGTLLESPYRWRAIGDPETISLALAIPGGALAKVRNASGTTDLTTHELVQITAVRVLDTPRFATPAPLPDPG
jgi:uncharacterized protein YlxW (UPF0749 family)